MNWQNEKGNEEVLTGYDPEYFCLLSWQRKANMV